MANVVHSQKLAEIGEIHYQVSALSFVNKYLMKEWTSEILVSEKCIAH
jgi:hypothetical protein